MKTENDVLLLYKGNGEVYYEVDRNVDTERWDKLMEPGEEYLLISCDPNKLNYLSEDGLLKKDLFDLVVSNPDSFQFERTNDPAVFNYYDKLSLSGEKNISDAEIQSLRYNSKSSQEILYAIDGGMFREIIRSSDPNWEKRKEETLNNGERYLCLECPGYSHELNKNVLWELGEGVSILAAMIAGDKKEFEEEVLKNILLNPETPLKASATNDVRILSWHKDQADYYERVAENLQEQDYDAHKYYEKAAEEFRKQYNDLAREEVGIGSDKMQIIVVNDKGLLIELSTEEIPQKYLQQHEIEDMAKGLSTQYPEGKIMVIEIDKKKYLEIDGVTPDVVKMRDKLLKEEGEIMYNCEIPKEIKQKDVASSVVQKKNTVIDKDINDVVKKEDRNAIDVMQSYWKLLFLILKDIFVRDKKAKKEEVTLGKAPEILQIVTIELEDGSILELKSEKNKNLFLQPEELKAYAEDVINANGKFRLIEIPKDQFPDAGKYLEKGIMTEEGKRKYQADKEYFLKNHARCSAMYEVSGKPEKEKIEETNISHSRQIGVMEPVVGISRPKGRGIKI